MDATGVDALIVYGEPSAVMSPDSYFTGGVCAGVEEDPRSPTVGYDLPVEPGVTFALHVTCDLGRGTVTHGDTVLIGSTGPRAIGPQVIGPRGIDRPTRYTRA